MTDFNAIRKELTEGNFNGDNPWAYLEILCRHFPALLAREKRLTEALSRLCDAVGNMRAPQTKEDVAMLLHITVGPALIEARIALSGTDGGKNV